MSAREDTAALAQTIRKALDRVQEEISWHDIPHGMREASSTRHRVEALRALDALVERLETAERALAKNEPRMAEIVADYVAQLEEMDAERTEAEARVEALQDALRELLDTHLDSEFTYTNRTKEQADAFFRAVARARAALAGTPGELAPTETTP